MLNVPVGDGTFHFLVLTNFRLIPLFVCQVPPLQPGALARTLLPMVLFQNVAPGAPNSLLQVAVKNNQQPVWYFNDKIPLHVFFAEDGRMERAAFLEVMSLFLLIHFLMY